MQRRFFFGIAKVCDYIGEQTIAYLIKMTYLCRI